MLVLQPAEGGALIDSAVVCPCATNLPASLSLESGRGGKKTSRVLHLKSAYQFCQYSSYLTNACRNVALIHFGGAQGTIFPAFILYDGRGNHESFITKKKTAKLY